MVKVEKPIYGGNFATSDGGQITYVLPGEVVEDEGDSLRIVEPSPERVEPRCVHFGVCGGCQYQHAGYSAQLAIKRQILEEILAQSGLAELPAIEVHSGPEWHYRNRIRLRVNGGELGYSRRGSNEFLPIRMCPIAAPVLWRAAAALMELAQNDSAAGQWLKAASEVEFFTTPDESRVQATFYMHDAEAARRGNFAALCERLQQRTPELASAGAVLDPELNRRIRRKATWTGAEWGTAGIAYAAAGRSYWVPRGAFFQVNRFLIDRLVELVCGGQTGQVAWDLFAGVGLFTRELAEHFARVVAVEGSEIAAAALAAAGRPSKDRRGFEAVQAATLDFLRSRQHQRERPDLIVLDPPRAGLGIEGAEILGRIAPDRIVYVSCDPTTLGRDLGVLRGEYKVDSVHLIDLFPQTFHMETVVRLQRENRQQK